MKPSPSRSSELPVEQPKAAGPVLLADEKVVGPGDDATPQAGGQPHAQVGRGICGAVAAQRKRRRCVRWLGPVVIVTAAVVAVAVVVSAITMVVREPFGPTGVVLPTRPLTTTTAPPAPPPPPVVPIPSGNIVAPPATKAPSAASPTPMPTASPPEAPPSPPSSKPPTTKPSSSRPAPSSVHPTTHRPFPQETTDFLGPPGTNA